MRKVAGKLLGRDRWKPSHSPLSRQEAQREATAVVQEAQGCCGRTRGSSSGNGWEAIEGGTQRQPWLRAGILDLEAKHCGRCGCNSLAASPLPSPLHCGGIPATRGAPSRAAAARRAGAGRRGRQDGGDTRLSWKAREGRGGETGHVEPPPGAA